MSRILLVNLTLVASVSLFSQTKMFIQTTTGTDSVWLSDVRSIYFKTYSSTQRDMIEVAGGTFTAGSTIVTISGFKIDKYEVTYELWTDVRDWGLTHGYSDLFAGANGDNPIGSNNPLTGVNWYDVVKWCNARSEKEGFAPVYYTRSVQDTVYRTGVIDVNSDAVNWSANGYRLPTECEWEFAAKGGTLAHVPPYTFSGSNNIDSVAWYAGNSEGGTHTVGQKGANELGLYDMTGNVWEWCWDWVGTAYPSGGITDNPKGPPTTQTFRSVRGGGVNNDAVAVIVRQGCEPFVRSEFVGGSVGFRCVQN